MSEESVSRALQLYAIPVTLGVGVLSNIFVMMVMKRFCSILSTCLYLTLAGAVDALVLCILAGNAWIDVLHGTDIRHEAQHHTNSLCKMYPFVENVLVHLSVWLLSAACIETAAVTLKPSQLARICTKERARAATLLLFVLLVCVNAHSFWTYALVKQEKSGGESYMTCSNVKQGNIDSEEFRRIAWPVIDFVIADLAPYFVLFSASVIVVTRRIRRSETLRHSAQLWKLHTLDASTAKQLHTAIIALAICHLLLVLPKLSYDIFAFLEGNLKLWKTAGDDDKVPIENAWKGKKKLAKTVSSLCMYSFLALKFFVYSISSIRFRVEVVNVLTCCCPNRTPPPPPPPPISSTANHLRQPATDPLLASTELPNDHPAQRSTLHFSITSV